MAVQRQVMTAEDFDAYTLLPENSERLFEFVVGEVVEVPSNPYSSEIALKIAAEIRMFLKGKGLGHVTGDAGGYMVSGERYAPDVAYISKARQPKLPYQGYNPIAPDLAVEVVSPSDSEKLLRVTLANYLAAGTAVWVVYPQDKQVEVYAPGEPAQILGETQTLTGGLALPGFQMALSDLFQTD